MHMNTATLLNSTAPTPRQEQRDDEPTGKVTSVRDINPDSAGMGVKTTGILTAEQWLNLPVDTDEKRIVLGSANQPIIRTLTKNIIEAPEKAFKTSFLLRLMLGVSCGVTVYSPLPVLRPRKVLYIHGELSPPEIQERTRSAVVDLERPLENFFQVRDLQLHLIQQQGQDRLQRIIELVNPDDLVLDPWQSFIVGHDENEYKEISRACSFVDHLIEDFNLTAYIATHTGKDKRRGTRGHSVLAGWRDTLTKLEREKGQARVWINVEPRWAAPPAPFSLRLEQGTLVQDGFRISPFTRQAESIREVIAANNGKVPREIIGQTLQLGADALRQALKRATDSGAIKLDGEDVML
jgi:hypothetical protein